MIRCPAPMPLTRSRTWFLALLVLPFVASSARAQVLSEATTYLSGTKRIKVEYFAPATPGRYPTVVLLHGSGGLGQSTGDLFRAIASELATHGYAVLIPQYFDKTDHVIGKPNRQGEYEAWLDAVNDAIEDAAKRPFVDPTRFAAMGWSMGSGLATFRAVKDPRIKAVSSISGTYPPIKPSKKLPPLLILHGSKDKSTPLDYVKKYAIALKDQEMPHAVHVYNGMGHVFDLPTFEDATRRSIAFFDQYVKPTTTTR